MGNQTLLPNIAFFDSGQGGFTVWESVVRHFSDLNTQYLGDNARCPYGNKGEQTITRYACEAAFFLTNRQAELVVVACGTASSVAVPQMQKIFKTPVIGIVEGLCSYAASVLGGDLARPVAVIATRFTINSGRFHDQLALHGVHNLWTRACPLFVPLVEEGIVQGPMVQGACEMYLWDIPKDVKIILLACTHYPRLVQSLACFLEAHLGRSVIYKTTDGDLNLCVGPSDQGGDPIYLLDPAVSIVQKVGDFLEQNHHISLFEKARYTFCTDAPERFERVAKIFTRTPLDKIQLAQLT